MSFNTESLLFIIKNTLNLETIRFCLGFLLYLLYLATGQRSFPWLHGLLLNCGLGSCVKDDENWRNTARSRCICPSAKRQRRARMHQLSASFSAVASLLSSIKINLQRFQTWNFFEAVKQNTTQQNIIQQNKTKHNKKNQNKVGKVSLPIFKRISGNNVQECIWILIYCRVSSCSNTWTEI